jgi:hypothetical protein
LLRDALGGGLMAAKAVLAAARNAGISERTLRQVKSQERVEARRTRASG